MRIAFFLNTPAQVHLHRHVINGLAEKKHDITILARDYGDTTQLLEEFGMKYQVYLSAPSSKVGKIASFPMSILNAYSILRPKKPELIIDAGAYGAMTSMLLGCRCIVFSDSEQTPIQLLLLSMFVDVILTPECFSRDLGRRHFRVNSYKELAYLHPDRFKPDSSILNVLGLSLGEEFAVLRLNAFDALHDLGIRGFSLHERRKLVHEIAQHCRVFISSESDLPNDLASYSLKIPKSKIHDVLYHAKLVVADTGTMITEAACLGTPAVLYHPSARRFGNFVELEQDYGLVFGFDNSTKAIDAAIRLAAGPDVRKEWRSRRDKMLADKINFSLFLTSLIEHFPDSIERLLQTNEDRG